MKKLIALTTLLAVLIVAPAAPAFAYKRKRTVTVGVDPNVVVHQRQSLKRINGVWKVVEIIEEQRR